METLTVTKDAWLIVDKTGLKEFVIQNKTNQPLRFGFFDAAPAASDTDAGFILPSNVFYHDVFPATGNLFLKFTAASGKVAIDKRA